MKKVLVLFVYISKQIVMINAADPNIMSAAQLETKEKFDHELLEAVQQPMLHSHPDGILRSLVERGADPKVRGADGMTPLMRLVELSNPAGVEELLAACSNAHELLEQKTSDGLSVIELARQGACGGDSDELVLLLQKYASSAVVNKSIMKAD